MAGPVKKFQVGGISCALWENEMKIDGQAKAVLKATIERRYKDKDGEWRAATPTAGRNAPGHPRAAEGIRVHAGEAQHPDDKVEEEIIG